MSFLWDFLDCCSCRITGQSNTLWRICPVPHVWSQTPTLVSLWLKGGRESMPLLPPRKSLGSRPWVAVASSGFKLAKIRRMLFCCPIYPYFNCTPSLLLSFWSKSFVLSTFGFTAVAFVTGSLALWAPAFLFRAAVFTGEKQPCVKEPCDTSDRLHTCIHAHSLTVTLIHALNSVLWTQRPFCLCTKFQQHETGTSSEISDYMGHRCCRCFSVLLLSF